jgi:drug/metabolite transporter (DMT)-like permease
MSLRRYLILAIVTLTASFGDTLLARGMKTLPPVSLSDPMALIHAIFSPWVAAGIVVLIGFFSSYITALSFADLTYVLPATSLGYVVMTVLARWWLHEYVSPWRWLGVLCITAGVGFVTRGPAYTHHEDPAETAVLPESQEVSR